MADLRGLLVVSLLMLLTARAQLVEIVTPQSVESVTVQEEEESNVAYKREATNNGTLDSYLQALKESHGSTNRYDPPPTNDLYQPDDHQGEISYGPPKGYQPKPASYHNPPSRPSPPVMYGPPAPVPSYLPPAPVAPPPGFYGVPFAAAANLPQTIISSVLGSILPKGLDLEVVFKLLVKLALFKMIVKFIAVLCLMMAWPLFQSKDKEMMQTDGDGDGDDNDKRQFEALNDISNIVWRSIFPKNGTTEAGDDDDDDDDGSEIVEKVAGQIDEKMTVPSEEAAIGFLEFCVAAANTAVGWMMSFVRRRNNEMDPMEQFLWSTWENIKSKLFTVVVEDSHLRTI